MPQSITRKGHPEQINQMGTKETTEKGAGGVGKKLKGDGSLGSKGI